MKRQAGVTGVELVVCVAAVVVLGIGLTAYGNYVQAGQEIAPKSYEELSALASSSCAGTAYLKEVSKQPILAKSLETHMRELERLKDQQARLKVRERIAGATPSCPA